MTDGACRCQGGSELMPLVTGLAVCSVVCGAFASVEPDAVLAAAMASVFGKPVRARGALRA
ncbi:MAG: hypothetical protein ACLUEK_15030 [Oscillospiraceae bacterium]